MLAQFRHCIVGGNGIIGDGMGHHKGYVHAVCIHR